MRSRSILLLVAAGLAASALVLSGRLGGRDDEAASVGPAAPGAEVEAAARDLAASDVAAPTVASQRTALADEATDEASDEVASETAGAPTVDLLVLVDRGQAGRVPLTGVTIHATRGESLGDSRNRTLDLTGNAPSDPDRPLRIGETDARGRLTAKLPRTGWFVFHPDPESLPEGVAGLAEFGLDRELGSVHSNGAHVFHAGERAEVMLLLPAAGELVVTVRDAGGAPVERATVQLALRSDLELELGSALRLGRAKRRRTDVHGRVTFERVPQGEVGVTVEEPVTFPRSPGWSRRADDPLSRQRTPQEIMQPIQRRALPAPRRVRVDEGLTTEVELGLGAGACDLSGRIVDENGDAIRGTEISIHYARKGTGVFGETATLPSLATIALRTVTDDTGHFQAGGLEPGPYRLEIQATRTADAYGLQTAPAMHEVPASAPGEAHVDAGEIVVPDPELFVVHGRVVLTSSKQGATPLSLANVRPWVISSRGGSQFHWSYDEATGEFTTACVLPFPPFQLRVGQYQGAEHYQEYEFVPEPDVTLEGVELRYP